MPRLGFAIDNRACIGCHACTVACKSEHDAAIGINRTWVKYIEKGQFPNNRRSFSVQRCNHCEHAPCVEICPVTSLYQRPDGIVDFDPDRCIGCKACMQACPYDALYLDPRTNTAGKCNYCTHRVDAGYEPACVVVCPVDAIVSGDLDDPTSKISELDRTQRVQYPKVEKNTHPKLFYVGGETAALDPTQAPPATEYLWSSSDPPVSPAALEAARREADEQARARRVYDAKPKPARWGWKVSAYLTTKAIAAGIVMVAFGLFAAGRSSSMLPLSAAACSLAFLAITGVLLIADLARPEKFINVLLRPNFRSWLVRGAYVFGLFTGTTAVCAVLAYFDAPRSIQYACGAANSLLAMAAAAYTALLFAQAKGRDYWQNPLLPITMLTDAATAGASALVLLGAVGIGDGLIGDAVSGPSADLTRFVLGGLIFMLGLTWVAEYLPRHQTRGAQLAAKLILRGMYRGWFWIGVVAIGLVIPAVLVAVGWGMPLVALCALIGITCKNHVLVQAPQRVPLS